MWPNTHFCAFQMQSWSKRGLAVACITSESTPHMMSGVMAGDYQLVFFYTRNTPDEVKMKRYVAW